MRVLLDEDCPEQLVDVLRHLLPGHTVDHVPAIGWNSKKDRFVFADAKRAKYDVIVTKDRSQLDDPEETTAIKKSGLHHVRFRQRRKGMEGLALAIGAVVAAMPSLMAALDDVDSQRLVHIAGLHPRDRFVVTDPAKDPPRYWR